MTWVPDACTLPTAEQPLRVADFEDFFRRAVVGVERVSERRAVLVLVGEPGVLEAARDLVERESACCSFFAFDVVQDADGVRFAVEVPPGQVPVLDGLVSRAQAALDSSGRR